MFTDCYGEQSCTAGRSSFITGQSVFRTGLSKVGIPAAPTRYERKDHHDCGGTEEPGLRDRPNGQNHLGDLNHMSADQPRLRRILR